ncbi:MAG TPA: hypothetical protein VEY69_10105 [Lautropia sp.]|nr:hypothetical protein [Lautropia sp.]
MSQVQSAPTPAADVASTPRHSSRARVDARGCPVSTESIKALEHAEVAQWRLLSYFGDPITALDAAIAEDPSWSLPRLMKANALLSMAEHGWAELAKQCVDETLASTSRYNERERAHLSATQLCLRGQWGKRAMRGRRSWWIIPRIWLRSCLRTSSTSTGATRETCSGA